MLTVQTKSNTATGIEGQKNSCCLSPIRPIIELAQDLIVVYIFTKFGADWLIL